MAEFAGKALALTYNGTNLVGDFRHWTTTEETALVDASSGFDSNRTYIGTLKDGTGTLEVLAQDTATTVWDAVVPGTVGSLIWGEHGSAVGSPKHTVNAIVHSRKKDSPYDELVVITVEFQFSGAVADATY